MNKEDEDNLLKWLKDKDVSEVMDLLMRHGNRYSRRILKFFRWFCKYVPITLMCFHAYGIYEFSQHPREMFIPYAENAPCYLYTPFYGVRLANGFDISKPIFLLVLEIPHSLLLLCKHQCGSHCGMELVYHQRYGRFLLYGHGGNGNILSVLFCGFVYQSK